MLGLSDLDEFSGKKSKHALTPPPPWKFSENSSKSEHPVIPYNDNRHLLILLFKSLNLIEGGKDRLPKPFPLFVPRRWSLSRKRPQTIGGDRVVELIGMGKDTKNSTPTR